jgi:hypothetical protein
MADNHEHSKPLQVWNREFEKPTILAARLRTIVRLLGGHNKLGGIR